jgi:hypothetical protein
MRPTARHAAAAARRLLAAAVLLTSCAESPTRLTPLHASAVRDSVMAAMADFARHSANAHWDSLGTLYSDTPGFRFAENGAVPYRSAAAARDALARRAGGRGMTTSYRDTHIDPLAPGWAVATTQFERVVVDSTGARSTVNGVLTLVWEDEGGAWRIRSGHASASPQPGAAP